MSEASLALVMCVALASCDDGGSSDGTLGANGSATSGGDGRIADGATFGRIERLPGGTAVPADLRTLVSLTCADGELTLATSSERIEAMMDCGQTPPDDTLRQFVGQPVAMAYADGRLRIESASVGTLDLPARAARLTED